MIPCYSSPGRFLAWHVQSGCRDLSARTPEGVPSLPEISAQIGQASHWPRLGTLGVSLASQALLPLQSRPPLPLPPPSALSTLPQFTTDVSQGPWRGGSQDEHPNSFDWSLCSTVSPSTPASMPSTGPHSLVPAPLKLLLSRQVTQGTRGPAPVHPVASPSTPDPEGSCSPPLLPVLIPLPEMPFLPSLLAQLRHAP